MAARYVNPDNVTAQGQDFYTGLKPSHIRTATQQAEGRGVGGVQMGGGGRYQQAGGAASAMSGRYQGADTPGGSMYGGAGRYQQAGGVGRGAVGMSGGGQYQQGPGGGARGVQMPGGSAWGAAMTVGLPKGSYETGGGGAGNVYGAGSGGNAGVAADRTGSDSSKSWRYASNWQFGQEKGDAKDPPFPGPVLDPPSGDPPVVGPDDEDIPMGEIVDDPWPQGPQLGRGWIEGEIVDDPMLEPGNRALGPGRKALGPGGGRSLGRPTGPLAIEAESEHTKNEEHQRKLGVRRDKYAEGRRLQKIGLAADSAADITTGVEGVGGVPTGEQRTYVQKSWDGMWGSVTSPYAGRSLSRAR